MADILKHRNCNFICCFYGCESGISS